MARVALEDWQEQIRDPKIECMSRDEMTALQSERLVRQVKNVYENVAFYRKKMDDMGVEPGDIKGIEDIGKLPFTTKEDLRANYPFGLLAVPQEKIVRVQGTSGTTGKLTLASYTEKDVDVWGECVARGLTMAGLNAADRIHICYGYGLFTGGLGLTSEPESLAQWQSRCLQVIQRDSSCVWKILEPQHLHVRHLMPFILVRLQKRQEWLIVCS